jgi:hypothetical protein
MEVPQRCSVQVTINGVAQLINNVGLGPGTTVEYVEDRVRKYLGVVGGMLSHHEDSLEMVNLLEAGQVYYFFRSPAPQAPPPAGEHSSRADARLRQQLLSLSLSPLFFDALHTMYMCTINSGGNSGSSCDRG